MWQLNSRPLSSAVSLYRESSSVRLQALDVADILLDTGSLCPQSPLLFIIGTDISLGLK